MSSRPNLLFMFSDQQSSDMIGCYGNPDAQTPNLDRMAREGVRFSNCVSNVPVCTPWRGSLLSGQHPLYHGAVFNDFRMLPGNGNYLGEILRDAGYRTGYIGKWHLYGGVRERPVPPGPYRYGFDEVFLTNNCTHQYAAGKAWYWDHNGRCQYCPKWEPDTETDQALDFLDNADGRPWALIVSWHPPHDWGGGTYEAPAEWLERFDPDQLTLRPETPENDEVRRMYQGYHAMGANLDWNVGRLLDKLAQRGELENTLIVYTSDHGDCLGRTDRYGAAKCRPETESTDVPLLVRFPPLLGKGRTYEGLMQGFDLMPTLLEWLGLEVPSTCHGNSLASAIAENDPEAVTEVPLFLSAANGQDWRGLRTRRYIYSFGRDGERYNRLYDLEKDPAQQTNLFDDPAYRKIRDDLHKRTVAWMDYFGDHFVPFEEMAQQVLVNGDAEVGAADRNQRGEGAVRGRPVDILEGQKNDAV